ncbi:MAG: redoxin family protein, partial [Clostridia bacterium]|nr:redoxin family protein [Clostridia bacterium]
QAHKDDLAILAVHSSMVVDDVNAFISEKGFEMPFAIDTEEDTIWNVVGGSSAMPQTIVLNRKGEVIYNQTKSMTAEMLSALYEQAAGDSGMVNTMPAAEAEQSITSYESSAPVGNEPGMQLADFTVQCLDGSTFHLADTRGKVTFVNLWATYCTPCIQELPHFNALYQTHKDDIAMLAVHSSMVVDDVNEFVSDNGFEMPFTIDTEEDTVWNIVGGSSTMPQTIVLNRKGEVIYNQTKSMTPEMLNVLYEQAAGENVTERLRPAAETE